MPDLELFTTSGAFFIFRGTDTEIIRRERPAATVVCLMQMSLVCWQRMHLQIHKHAPTDRALQCVKSSHDPVSGPSQGQGLENSVNSVNSHV